MRKVVLSYLENKLERRTFYRVKSLTNMVSISPQTKQYRVGDEVPEDVVEWLAKNVSINLVIQ